MNLEINETSIKLINPTNMIMSATAIIVIFIHHQYLSKTDIFLEQQTLKA